jgi:4-amino-4-deoxy-L-arabinose transferase-like glycosyltransferase
MRSGPSLVLLIAAGKLLFHLFTANRYGIFRDELYYLACADHLDWGYVDQPPLIAAMAWFARHVFGDSLLGLRLLPAVAGAALVWLTGKLSRELGGGRFAQALAALSVACVPIYLVFQHWLTMNAFEPLIWTGCAWFAVRAIRTSEPRYWLAFGVLAGIGMENKYSMAFFVTGMVAGLLLSPERRAFRNRWMWLGALAAFLIFLPNLIWLVRHNFPFLELMSNVRSSNRDIVRGPLAFVLDQAMLVNPVLFPLWVAGLAWLLFNRAGRRYAVLGWTYLVMLVLFIALKGKNYYLAPAYPMLLAAGAIAFEQITSQRIAWGRPVYLTLLIAVTAILAPLFAPILPVETYIRYQNFLGLEPPKSENQRTGPLPQYFADEFGWDEMTRAVAKVYFSLPPSERATTAIFANDYGQAGAIDFFGPKYGLPKSISGHQNYWYWGPRGYTGETVIVLGSDGRGDREHFASVEVAGRVEHPYSRLDEHFDIFLCRRLNVDLQTLWPQVKHWN